MKNLTITLTACLLATCCPCFATVTVVERLDSKLVIENPVTGDATVVVPSTEDIQKQLLLDQQKAILEQNKLMLNELIEASKTARAESGCKKKSLFKRLFGRD